MIVLLMLFYVLSCKYWYYVITFIFNCYLLIFLFPEITQNGKKRKYENSGVRCLKSCFGTNWLIFIVILSMLQFKLFDFHISMWLFQITIFMRDSELLFYDLLKKGFRGNFGSILDFSGIPSKVDIQVHASP